MIFNRLIFSAFVLLVFSCSSSGNGNQSASKNHASGSVKRLNNDPSDPKSVSSDNEVSDTTLIFMIAGKRIVISTEIKEVDSILKEEHLIDSIANHWRGMNLDSTLVIYRDVTGDCKPEKLVSHLFHIKTPGSDTETFILTHNVYLGKENIYCDTLNFNTGFVDDIDNAFYPYSYFGGLLEYIPMDVKFSKSEFLKNEDMYMTNRKWDLQSQHISNKKIEKDQKEFKDYLLHFHGYIIKGTNFIDGWTSIWYEPEHKFVPFGGP